MEKNKKILSPKLDIVFKMLFGEQKHERITKKLIEDIIEEKVEKIELEQTPYLFGMQADDKIGIIDVRATINDKNSIDIEMQIIDNHDIEKRVLFYWSRLYSKQIERGENYDKLNRTISIIFLDYEMDKLKNLPTHTKWQIRDTENGKTLLTEDLEIHIIEIPKINKMLKSGKLKKWIMFLENPNGEETKKMAEEDEEIKEAIKTLKEISNDEEKERIAELRLKYLLDKKSEERTAREKGLKQGLEEGRKKGLEEGRKEGIKEGIEQGKEKGKKEKAKEIARKMLEENIPLDLIVKITGLTKEEIKQNVL
ncbi:MAG: Rpn family recombination-promoting nuclease/putative transposase [Clostridia bacterium]|nr:Rpn family recombination-promoting nuclease/putative transposase [Clostridia bacterium]